MIGALGELSPYMLRFCLNMGFKGRVLMVYSIPRVMLITVMPRRGIRSTIKI